MSCASCTSSCHSQANEDAVVVNTLNEDSSFHEMAHCINLVASPSYTGRWVLYKALNELPKPKLLWLINDLIKANATGNWIGIVWQISSENLEGFVNFVENWNHNINLVQEQGELSEAVGGIKLSHNLQKL